MKLWLLRPASKYAQDDGGPWDPWYDKMFGLVARAETDGDARRLAADAALDEGRVAWLSPDLSTCEVLVADNGESEGIVISDMKSA